MNEVQRMQYLDALGIDSFMPRRVLPNAPALRMCEPVLSGAVGAQAASAPATSAPATSTPDIAAQASSGLVNVPPAVAAVQSQPDVALSSSADAGAKPVVEAPLTAAPAVLEQVVVVTAQVQVEAIKTVKAVIATPRFSLSMWQVGEQLLVIDSRQPQQALPTESLLSNILLALGFPAGPLPSAHVVRWPIMENRFESQGPGEARGMLSALIAARLETQPAKHLLLMGEEACHYILPSDELAESQTQSLSKLQGRLLTVPELAAGLPVIVVPSLTAMLQEPELKAITWQAIQPLRQ